MRITRLLRVKSSTLPHVDVFQLINLLIRRGYFGGDGVWVWSACSLICSAVPRPAGPSKGKDGLK